MSDRYDYFRRQTAAAQARARARTQSITAQVADLVLIAERMTGVFFPEEQDAALRERSSAHASPELADLDRGLRR
jgi:hypothetical protein